MKLYLKVLMWLVIGSVALLGIRIVLFPLFVADKVVDTAQGVVAKTMNADNALFNYELFHDLSQGVKQAEANIRAQDQAIATLTVTYGEDALKWPKDVRERYAFINETKQGYITQYNRLAGDYNAQSRKLNRNLFRDKGLPHEIPLWTP